MEAVASADFRQMEIEQYRSVVIAAAKAYFAALQKTYFSDGLTKLEHRWVACIELKGDYVEK